jgi:TonB family protein
MSRLAVIAFIFACTVPAIAGLEEKFTVSGVGMYPISHSIESMWLAAPDNRPLLMVYFHGPEDWHNTKWKIDSKFEKGKPGWVELQSDKATLRLSMNTETGEAGVQSGKFKITESNTFLVLHTAEPPTPQKIVPLGIFDLPASKDQQPASVLLLRANPEIMDRINKEVASSKKQPTGAPQGVVGDVPGGLPTDDTSGIISSGPRSTPDASPARVRVAEKVMRVFLVTKVNPSYPSEAEKKHVDGTVLLHIIIDKNGNVSKLEPVSGHPLLLPAAIEAVKQWKYRPYLLNQEPVEVETTVLIKFVITDGNTYSVIAFAGSNLRRW